MFMDLYIEREDKRITLEEWKKYISTDKELLLCEMVEGINPLTKMALYFESPGRVLWNGIEVFYKDGKIGCEGDEEGLIEKLRAIAEVFSASVYDCGEKI